MIIIFYATIQAFQQTMALYPILDNKIVATVPNKFRTMHDTFASMEEEKAPTREGLDQLFVSGSAQFSEESLKEILKRIPASKLIIIDLRLESHGLVNGKPVSWTDCNNNSANIRKNLAEIEKDERNRLKRAQLDKLLVLNTVSSPQSVEVQTVKTEKELVESLGITYVRFPARDHYRPSDQVVDDFIRFFAQVPSDVWIHLHCKGGKGRTTTFMIMMDMMRNSKKVGFEDIMKRQKLIGGNDLFKLHEPEHYKHIPAKERLEFLKKFYDYCRQNPAFQLTWSEWNKRHS